LAKAISGIALLPGITEKDLDVRFGGVLLRFDNPLQEPQPALERFFFVISLCGPIDQCLKPGPAQLLVYVKTIDVRTKIVFGNSMRCALYARVSTTDQTCQMQLRELSAATASASSRPADPSTPTRRIQRATRYRAFGPAQVAGKAVERPKRVFRSVVLESGSITALWRVFIKR
jgi:hypothetical protein